MKTLAWIAALLATAGMLRAADESSLAERAESAKKKEKKPAVAGHVLTNEDLKKAKGNVIYLSPSPSPAPTPVPIADPPLVASAPSGTVVPASAPADLVREMDELQGRAMRLRGTLEQTQAERVTDDDDQRAAVDKRIRETLDELTRTHEKIGALSERMQNKVESPGSSDGTASVSTEQEP